MISNVNWQPGPGKVKNNEYENSDYKFITKFHSTQGSHQTTNVQELKALS